MLDLRDKHKVDENKRFLRGGTLRRWAPTAAVSEEAQKGVEHYNAFRFYFDRRFQRQMLDGFTPLAFDKISFERTDRGKRVQVPLWEVIDAADENAKVSWVLYAQFLWPTRAKIETIGLNIEPFYDAACTLPVPWLEFQVSKKTMQNGDYFKIKVTLTKTWEFQGWIAFVVLSAASSNKLGPWVRRLFRRNYVKLSQLSGIPVPWVKAKGWPLRLHYAFSGTGKEWGES